MIHFITARCFLCTVEFRYITNSVTDCPSLSEIEFNALEK